MKKTLTIGFFLIIGLSSSCQTFREFLAYMNSLPVNQRQSKADSFMVANPRLPITESDTVCSFIYKGTASNVMIAGDFTAWSPGLAMVRTEGTDLWSYTDHCEEDARLDYKIVVDGTNWILDPKNPYTCTGGFGPNSELRMPWYLIPPETSYYPAIPHGMIRDTTFHSPELGNSRQVMIYLPPGYYPDKKYPLALFHDGPEFLSLGNTANILDYLIFYREIVPVIGVFVAPVDREPEYAGSKKDAFTGFIINELMPVLEQKYAVSTDPHQRATLGISNGGNIALYLGMKYPASFGKIAAESSNVETIISDTFTNGSKLDLELYLDIGKYDIPRLIPLVNNFVQILRDRNYAYQFKEWHEGHSWGNWKGHVSIALRQFFSPDTQK